MLYLLYVRNISIYKTSKRILGVITLVLEWLKSICWYKYKVSNEGYKISNKTKNDINWNTLEDSATLHMILWIQSFIPFLWLLSCHYLIIVGGLCPTDYDDVVSSTSVHLWQGVMKRESLWEYSYPLWCISFMRYKN